MYVISECGETVFPYTSVEDGSEVTILFNQIFGFRFQILFCVCLPTTMGLKQIMKKTVRIKEKIARVPWKKTYSLLHYWYKSMKYLG